MFCSRKHLAIYYCICA